ncbi:hypothetical protein BC936DRAFT_144715 [Jimgerdemannia flammicorona]|uniref:Endoplasmic reticulum vesicle transporter C-terminal domain-containing protein n=1 Tax=Jimgerdemannia flammicorona TaxID=994334 RepID=A0A433DBU5_9FUNG|nr:hypothetical protein BC936DRAFT_144715 [Jimgerdemannia flammicorona]
MYRYYGSRDFETDADILPRHTDFEAFQYFISVVSFPIHEHHWLSSVAPISCFFQLPLLTSISAILTPRCTQVPTIYIDNADNTLMTNQYSVTDYRKTFDHENSRGMIPGPNAHHPLPNTTIDHTPPYFPSHEGLFFKYEIEAISVRITEHRQTFRYFIVRLCGILGGAFVTVGFAYRALRFIIDLPKGRPAPTGAGAAYIPTSNSEKRRL